MPRRARRVGANGSSSAASPRIPSHPVCQTAKAGVCTDVACAAVAARVTALLAKTLAALHDQRDLRVDLAATRARTLLLDGEYVSLHSEYERALAARDRLDALSRELTRQNKTVIDESERRIVEEKHMREAIVRRFNVSMRDINDKLAAQSGNRAGRDASIDSLRRKMDDLNERASTRAQHFEAAQHRRLLERKLDAARLREARAKHSRIATELVDLRARSAALRDEQKALRAGICGPTQFADAARDAQHALDEARVQVTRCEKRAEVLSGAAKELQLSNTRRRNDNSATNIRITAMHAEGARLEAAIADVRASEKRERAKREALEKLCRQVTSERTELHNEVLIMQEAWATLKLDIEKLKGQVGGGNRVFEVLQAIMNREYLDVTVTDVMSTGRSIEDAIREELSNLRLAADSIPVALQELAQPLAATASKHRSGTASRSNAR